MTRILGFGRSERGQMTALMAVSIVALCAMGAFVMDVGSWFRAHRATQTVADAAALAGAQNLPQDASAAQALAQQYGDKNGGGITQIQFSSNTFSNDTISVRAERVAPGFLSRVLGVASVNVGADAIARAWNLESARYAAPFAVDKAHPLLSGSGCPCFNQPTTLDLETVGPGAFRIVNIDGYRGGHGQQILSDWVLNGYDGYMGLGWSYSDPGAKFNPGPLEDALRARSGDELLFPVYDAVRAQGAGFEYNIVGWVGFMLTGFQGQGNNSELHGSFTSVVWEGMPSESGENFFGATVVKLVG
jgi:Putative Flp pilus-assembly TadE/G-like